LIPLIPEGEEDKCRKSVSPRPVSPLREHERFDKLRDWMLKFSPKNLCEKKEESVSPRL
jgi:hypothetical protein